MDITHLTTFRVPAQAAALHRYHTTAELLDVLAMANDGDPRFPMPLLHIGEGSNLLFACPFDGTVLHCERREATFTPGQVTASAGMRMDDLIAECCARGLWGLENLSGIPGEAGASVVQNVGAYGMEAADAVIEARAIDTLSMREVTFGRDEMAFGYRDSLFKHAKGRFIITDVTFAVCSDASPRLGYAGLRSLAEELADGDEITPQTVRDAVLRIRAAKLPDPAATGSAGSFFKNPVVERDIYERICASRPGEAVPHYDLGSQVKIPAAWLIDKAGCKELAVGGAALWPSQPLVIVNATGHATASDVLALSSQIIEKVRSAFGITLHPEVELIH